MPNIAGHRQVHVNVIIVLLDYKAIGDFVDAIVFDALDDFISPVFETDTNFLNLRGEQGQRSQSRGPDCKPFSCGGCRVS